MKLPKEKSAASAREAKRRLENPLTKAQKAEKAADDAERLRKIQRTKQIEIVRDLELWRIDEAMRGLKV
jgi:hypothetical protein